MQNCKRPTETALDATACLITLIHTGTVTVLPVPDDRRTGERIDNSATREFGRRHRPAQVT